MLQQPIGVLQGIVRGGVENFIPVPEGSWYLIATKAQAAAVLALVQANSIVEPQTLQMVDLSQDPSSEYSTFVMPSPNRKGYGIYNIVGKANGENFSEFAGDLWDRGPKDKGFGGAPDAVDNNGDFGRSPLGGEYLVGFDPTPGDGLIEFKWANTPQQPL